MGNGTKHVLHMLYRLVQASTRFEEKNRRCASLKQTHRPFNEQRIKRYKQTDKQTDHLRK